MQRTTHVKKFDTQKSLLALGIISLLANTAFAAPTTFYGNSKKAQTAGRIRQGPVQQNSSGNIVTLNQFNSELNVKVRQSQKVAGFTSLETITQKSSTKADGTKASPVSANLQYSYGESMYFQKDGSKSASQSLLTIISGKVSENYSLIGRFSLNNDLKDPKDVKGNGISDTAIILSQKHVELADWLKGGYSLTSGLPTSKYSQEQQNFKGSLGVSYTFAFTDAILAKGLVTSIALGASRNFHEYETDKAGNILNVYGMREILSAGYTLKEFSFSFEFIHRHAWNYDGDITQSFEHSEELGYSVTPAWSFAIGHTNGGAWLAPNGRDSNLKLVNKNASTVYGSMALSF